MDRKQLEWLLVQCQFNNSLGTSVMDSMAYYLLNEALERRADLCDPSHYLELDMHTASTPAGYKFKFIVLPAAQLQSWTVADDMVESAIRELNRTLEWAIRHNSGSVVAGTVRAHIGLNWSEMHIYVSFTTATKEQTHGDGTDGADKAGSNGTAGGGAASSGGAAEGPGDTEHKGDDPVPG